MVPASSPSPTGVSDPSGHFFADAKPLPPSRTLVELASHTEIWRSSCRFALFSKKANDRTYPGTAIGAAREKVRVAKALKTLPKISEAFRIGSISYSKVRAMTRIATPDCEDFLLNVARYGTASHLEKLVRNYRKVKRLEALAEEKARHDARQIQFHESDDGGWSIIAPA